MNKYTVRLLTRNAIVAAVYFLLTLVSFPISFGLIQVRIAEFLVLLCFFNRDYAIGITVGCLLANTLGPGNLGVFDIVFGTLATLVSCIGVSFCKHLLIASLIPVVVNSFTVAAILVFVGEVSQTYFAVVGILAVGEIIAVTIIGYIFFISLRKNEEFMSLIEAKNNKEFKW